MEIVYKINDFPNPGDRDVYLGIQEINKGNYQEAQKRFEKGSNYDNEYALLFNAFNYYTGFGFEKRDPSKAMNLFKKIAFEWNNPVAQYLIGGLYLEGDQGISRHEKHAHKWLSLAGENNWADAMVFLGSGYHNGNLFKKDNRKAVSWFQRVSQKDDSETEPIDNGVLYLFGNKEFELRLKGPEIISIIKYQVDQKGTLPLFYLDPSRRPTGSALNIITDTVFWSLFTNRKSCGIIRSQVSLCSMYHRGISDKRPSYQKSFYFLKKAAKNGSAYVCMSVGFTYEQARDGLQDYKEALRWYKRTLDLDGSIDAAYRIGIIYYNAKEVKSDSKLALKYFGLRVSHSDHGPAYLFMGLIYETGEDGVSQDYILARQHYEKAFDCGQVRAALALAKFYTVGLGVRKDNKKAEE